MSISAETARRPRHQRPLCPEDYYVEGWPPEKSEFVYNFGWPKPAPGWNDLYVANEVIRHAELELKDAEKQYASARYRHRRHQKAATDAVASARSMLMQLLLLLATTPGYDPNEKYASYYNRLDATAKDEQATTLA